VSYKVCGWNALGVAFEVKRAGFDLLSVRAFFTIHSNYVFALVPPPASRLGRHSLIFVFLPRPETHRPEEP
jgi:hypothetical protein